MNNLQATKTTSEKRRIRESIGKEIVTSLTEMGCVDIETMNSDRFCITAKPEKNEPDWKIQVRNLDIETEVIHFYCRDKSGLPHNGYIYPNELNELMDKLSTMKDEFLQ